MGYSPWDHMDYVSHGHGHGLVTKPPPLEHHKAIQKRRKYEDKVEMNFKKKKSTIKSLGSFLFVGAVVYHKISIFMPNLLKAVRKKMKLLN